MELNENTFYTKVVALNEIYNFVVLSFFYLRTLRYSKNNIKFRHLLEISKVTVHLTKLPKTGPGLKSERFQEFEGQSYPVLEFEVEI